MVSLEDYEQGWTQLSINHEEAEGLDSTNAFEGVFSSILCCF